MPIEKTVHIPAISEDIVYTIGKSAQENFDIIDDAEPTDLWFHVEGHSSSHVIATLEQKYDRKELKYIVKQGAILCKQHSRYSSNKNVDVIYTFIENVHKTKIPGSVTTSNLKTITI
tara:strand:- start:49 stop:399 length:351 start_codon:yes stop_codon:yes gene_type:complete